jgi:hypothetical protein
MKSTELIITSENVSQTMKMYGKVEVYFHRVLSPRNKMQKINNFQITELY